MMARGFTKTAQVCPLGLGQKRRPLGLSATIEKNEAALMKYLASTGGQSFGVLGGILGT